MIKNFEYKIPFDLKTSYEIILESGNKIPKWELVSADDKNAIIEWKQKLWSSLGLSRIKVYLTEPRSKNTLVTIYIYRPLQIFDPAKMCERVFKQLKKQLDATLEKRK
jgi:ribosome-interacting GTPase 1